MGKPGSLTPVGPGRGRARPLAHPGLASPTTAAGVSCPGPINSTATAPQTTPRGMKSLPGPSARDEGSSAHSGLSTQRTRLRCSHQGMKPGTPQHVAGLWSQLSCLSSKTQKGLCVRGPQGPVPLSLPELPTSSQDQGVPEDRASLALRTGVEERVTKGPP